MYECALLGWGGKGGRLSGDTVAESVFLILFSIKRFEKFLGPLQYSAWVLQTDPAVLLSALNLSCSAGSCILSAKHNHMLLT